MRLHHYGCDATGCGSTTTDPVGWFQVHKTPDGAVKVSRMTGFFVNDALHACGQQCMLNLVVWALKEDGR